MPILTLIALSFTIAATQDLPPRTGGTLIVLNKAEATASLIDLQTGKVVRTVEVGDGPHEGAASPDGRTVAVANYGGRGGPGSTLTMIDVSSGRATKTILLGDYRRPHGIEWLNNERIAVTCEANQSLLIVNVNTGRVIRAIKTDQRTSHMVVVTPDGKRAFVANIGSGTVSALDLANGKLLKIIPTGAGAEGIAISPDGKDVWVTNRAADTVSLIDAGTLKVKQVLQSASFPIRVKFTPDGSHALVSNARSNEVAIFDTKTKREIKRIKMKLAAKGTEGRLFGGQFGDSSVPIGILVHPSGRWAYIANANADVITVLDLSKWTIAGYLTAGKEPDGMAYSPIKCKAE